MRLKVKQEPHQNSSMPRNRRQEKIHDLQRAISVNYIQTTEFLVVASLAIQALLGRSSSPSEQTNTLRKTTNTIEMDLHNPT